MIRYRLFFLLWAVVSLQTACNVTKHLDDAKGERLLVKNTLQLKTEKPLRLSQKTPLMYELGTLYKQQPNSRSFGLFRSRLWLHYRFKDRNSRFARWINNKVAEPPTIYNDDLAQRTALNFQNFMRQRGYFDALCTYETSFPGQHYAKTRYFLEPGQLFLIDSVHFVSKDKAVQEILQAKRQASHLKPGAPLDGRLFDSEKLRITADLKNSGYAYFIPNYVQFLGDSTGTRAKVTVEVLQQSDSLPHQVYTLDDIEVFSSLVPDYSSIRDYDTINGVFFYASENKFFIKPERLYEAITLRPGMRFSQDEFDKTLRNLNSMGVFRFVSIRPVQDPTKPDRLDVAISFSPNDRFSIGGDLELNSSNSSSGATFSGRLLGLSSSVYARNRNLLGGAEQIQNNVQYNIEFDIGRTNNNNLIFSQEFKLQNQLAFPRYFDYLGMYKLANRLRIKDKRLMSGSLYERFRSDGRARIGLNYNYLDIPDLYVLNLFNASLGYDLLSDPEHQYSFENIGIDVLRPNARPLFDSLIQDNPFLDRSFGNQLFTGFLLRSFTYTYHSQANQFGERWFFRVTPEVSGLEVFLLNRLWSSAFGAQKWTISDLEFASYLRIDLEGSYSREFTPTVSGILRVGSGVITPFGNTSDAPYVKQFFVGGPSSLRAWRIREMGPGGYCDPRENPFCLLDPPNTRPFYQAADFRMEMNAELRFPLFWWFKGAVFVDAGNIWTLDADARQNSRLRWDSYKNIAVGTGFGVRADLDFFIIRLDMGLKLRSPYRYGPDGRYWVNNLVSKMQWRDWNPNLAVGYPF